MLKVAIVGLGTISYIHQMAIEKSGLAEIVAVCDIKAETRSDYKDYTFYSDLEEMLREEDLDVVHVCLPHDLHVPASKQILAHGIHVFLEKPIALNYQEASELIQVEKDSPHKVGVCFQNRYNRTTKELVKHLQANHSSYGKLKAVKGLVAWFRPESYYTKEEWRGLADRAGGGTIINQSIHTLDLMHYFAGELLATKASLSNLLDYDIEVEDTAVANFEFEQGRTGFYMATNAYVKNASVELELVFEHAEFRIKDYKLYQVFEAENRIELLTEDEQLEDIKSYYGQGHVLCIRSFYQAVIKDTEAYVHLTDALTSILMIDSMKKSSDENRKVEVKEIING